MARWRPAGRSGAAWQSDGSTARGVEERRELWRDAWEGHVKLEVAGLALSGGSTEQRRREAEEQAGGRRNVDCFMKSENSRDPTVKQQ